MGASQLDPKSAGLTVMTAGVVGGVAVIVVQRVLGELIFPSGIVRLFVAPLVVMLGVQHVVIRRFGMPVVNAKERIVSTALACFAVVIISTGMVGLLAPMLPDTQSVGAGGFVVRAFLAGVLSLGLLVRGFGIRASP